ncbi:hypothetical protein GGF32_005710 [Allomyces javanicus]|nr:hypothetical protein GGF32_005710 [Allomyces javanicus]
MADVTLANLNDIIKTLCKSPDIKPMGSVMINSYNGNTYGGVDLQLTVKAKKGSPTLVTDLVYPLCQKK